jgi:hypothetical protein
MTRSQWVRNEVKLAIRRERARHSESNDPLKDYAADCYISALRAYRCLMKDGHSGASIAITRDILMRLLTDRPITPIEDVPDVWLQNMTTTVGFRGETANYQCTRMPSLFKYVYADGSVKYRDIHSCYGVSVDNPKASFHNGLIQDVMDELRPVTMPYNPGKQTKFLCEDFLVDPKNGDYDTVGILRAQRPDGSWVSIDRYYKEDNNKFVQISFAEYKERYDRSIVLRKTRAIQNNLISLPEGRKILGLDAPSEKQEVPVNDPDNKGTDPGTAGAAQSCGDRDACPLCNPDRYSGSGNVPGDVGEVA